MDTVSQVALIAGKPVRYTVRRSARARRAILHVTHDEGLVVVTPRRSGLKEVDDMLRRHAAWIDVQVERFGVRDGPRRRELADGSEILVLGCLRRLALVPRPGTARATVRLIDAGGELRVTLPPEAVFDLRAIVERYLRTLARRWLKERVTTLARVVGVAPRRVIVGERRSRWGSCSARGNLSFCYRLVMAPPPVVDALVLHELCHLRHMNHGARFYRLYDAVCPDHRRQRAWLREHEGQLRL